MIIMMLLNPLFLKLINFIKIKFKIFLHNTIKETGILKKNKFNQIEIKI